MMCEVMAVSPAPDLSKSWALVSIAEYRARAWTTEPSGKHRQISHMTLHRRTKLNGRTEPDGKHRQILHLTCNVA